ncbi:hypothetical protein HYPSUDRAFT_68665 [Hypholoma sublateritium FD-334 SS-4]|uniref:Uncharacterized protein n=1 Tax=Hypholoma sublateritium (strain FD-334 SS-4) TaxID=945553 RepID=A0A0D2L0T9_HYPSF|nr:hypothetical protein HYPSUDRAFT_68665 [Hypholoma sublateritium FD-334 SS-4]
MAANPLTSPTLSSSFSEYDLVSNRSRSGSMVSEQLLPSNLDDSDDEIVWDISAESSASDSEFVLLSHRTSAVPSQTGRSTPNAGAQSPHTPIAARSLEEQMEALTLVAKGTPEQDKKASAQPGAGMSPMAKQKRKKGKKSAVPAGPTASGSVSTSPAPTSKSLKKAKHGKANAVVKYTGLGARPIVDDFSDQQSIVSYDNESVYSPTLYEEAASFISSFLSNPDAKSSSVYRLTLMQSIIIELGLATASLPSSLKSAKAFLKSRVFLNIREYIAVREQGPEAVQRAMYPSKTALIKGIRKNPTPIKWVKKHGLQVLLVGWMQH